MKNLTVELKKCKRTGILVVLPLVGLLGALYAFINFIVRKEVLLSLPLPPMDVLLTQLYGMVTYCNNDGNRKYNITISVCTVCCNHNSICTIRFYQVLWKKRNEVI